MHNVWKKRRKRNIIDEKETEHTLRKKTELLYEVRKYRNKSFSTTEPLQRSKKVNKKKKTFEQN